MTTQHSRLHDLRYALRWEAISYERMARVMGAIEMGSDTRCEARYRGLYRAARLLANNTRHQLPHRARRQAIALWYLAEAHRQAMHGDFAGTVQFIRAGIVGDIRPFSNHYIMQELGAA